jgi:hypothetical protein
MRVGRQVVSIMLRHIPEERNSLQYTYFLF